jgi:hypothetical protein
MSIAVLCLMLSASSGESLANARKLADALRYEEAVVEYQRYLGAAADRPANERAAALFELSFIHLVLGDEVTALARATDALELDGSLALPASAPAREADFLAQVKKQLATRARLRLEPRTEADGPQGVRAHLADPQGQVKRVLLRYALAAGGPFLAAPLHCEAEVCRGELPGPAQGGDFSAWYFVEALDSKSATVAQAASAREPLQLTVVGTKPWYQSPIVWGAAGGALIAIGIVIYLLAPPPPR